MGYNLSIGEFLVKQEPEYREVFITVITVSQIPGSPLNSSDDYSNYISPGYVAWDDFCNRTGLHRIFYDENGSGLLRPHPGCKQLTEDHCLAFKQALDRYAAKYERTSGLPNPDMKESFEEYTKREKTWVGKTEYDFRRLEWLVFWTRWALDNCKYPSFSNS